MNKKTKLLIGGGTALCIAAVSLTCGLYFGLKADEQPAVGHTHGAQWSYQQEENGKHTAICNVDGCSGVLTDCSFTERTILNPATCTTDGQVKLTCTCGNTRTDTIPAAKHQLSPHAANDATCTAEGNIFYYECSICTNYFKDEQGLEEISDKASVIVAATHAYGELIPETAATCTEKGNIAHYRCGDCKKYFNENKQELTDVVAPIDPTAHDLGANYAVGTSGEKIYTCNRNAQHTFSVALSSIEIVSEPDCLVKKGSAIDLAGFTLRAVYEDGSREPLSSTDGALSINASELTAHTVSVATLTYYGKTATTDGLPVHEIATTANTLTFGNYAPNTHRNVKTVTTGEFTYHFTLSNVKTTGTNVWDYWLLHFVTKNKNSGAETFAVLRADRHLLENFGRGSANQGNNGYTQPNAGFKTGDIDFTVTRTWETDHYRITVTMQQGDKTSVATIEEPTTNAAEMTLLLGGEKCNYTYSDIIVYAPLPAQNGLRLSATNVTVASGASLDSIKDKISVYQTFVNGTEASLGETDYTLTCTDYDADKAGEYTVTVTHGNFSATLTVKVLGTNAEPIERLDYYTVKTDNGQTSFTSGNKVAGNVTQGYNNGGYYSFYGATSIDNPFHGKASNGYVIHTDYNLASADAYAPLFGFQAAAGVNQAFLCIVTNNAGQWQISYNDMNGKYDDKVIASVQNGKMLCLAVRIDDAGVTVFIDGVSVLTLTEAVWQNAKTFVESADLFYFRGGGYKDNAGGWTANVNGGFSNFGFYTGTMLDEQVKKLARDPATLDFTIVSADTETDVTPLPVTYPSASIPSDKYVTNYSDTNTSQWGYANTHDPSVFKDPNSNYYYAYSTDANRGTTVTGGIHIRRSLDLIHWEYVNTAFRGNYPQAAIDHVKANSGNDYIFWAPDILYLNNRYYLYYCISQFGKADSYIGVAVSDDPYGPFVHDETHGGEIYKSTGQDKNKPNAIDPNVLYDASGNLWCFYGSFFGGIYAIQLDKATGLPLSGQGMGTHVAGGSGVAMEGPYVVMEGGYYYLFVSYGDLNTDYNVRVFRCPVSEGITGNYVDSQGYNAKVGASGKAITTSDFRLHGNKILGGYKIGDNMGYRAPGHMSVLKDGGNYYMVSHTRTDAMPSYNFFISVRQMFFTDDGWCVLNQNEYAGERLQAMNVANVMGVYDAVMTVTGTEVENFVKYEGGNPVQNVNSADAHETLSKQIAFNANGTVTGEHGTGDWFISDDYKITVTIGTDVYVGFVIAAKDSKGNNVISFTAINQNGVYLFGNCIK